MSTPIARIRVLSLTFAEDRFQNAQQLNVREMARRLDPSRFELTLLSEGGGPASVSLLPHVRLLRTPTRLSSAVILWHLMFRSYDVLFHAHAGRPEAIFMSLPRWLRGRRRRVLVSVEGDLAQLDEIPVRTRARLERLYRRADALFPITEYVASTIRTRLGRDGEVIPVGVDVEAFRPRSEPREPGPMRVLSVGKLKPWKRPELARLAAERLPEVEFSWIGTGELGEDEARKAPRNMSFSGSVNHDDLPDRYRKADVLLHPSRMEGLPKVVLEALASGIPVVAFDSYRPGYITEAGAGFVVSDPEAMVAALGTLAADEGLRGRMGAAARELAMRFSWEEITRKWEQVFEEAVRGSRRAAP